MLKNYIKIAWRNIIKRRFYSVLNISGLATGILFALLIGAYVWSELQVNHNLRNAGNQYFLGSKWKNSNTGPDITTLGPLAKQLKVQYPDIVANYYRWDGITSVISKGDKHLREGIQLGDSTLLSMYGFALMHGDKNTALNEPYNTVITKDIAIKYFGKTDVIGQTLNIQNFAGGNHDFTITGVLKDIPENSVTFLNDANNNQVFIPTNMYSFFGRMDLESWSNIYIPSYVELKEGKTPADLVKPIRQLISQNAVQGITENLGVEPIALTEYYLKKDNGLVRKMLYTLSFVGLFILLMAIVNFINISISSSSARLKEIGVRKVLGGMRKQIIVQFLTESTILVLIATSLAVILYPLVKPVFEGILAKEIPSLSSFPVYYIFIPAAAVLSIGLLAGIYPALTFSAIRSADSLKGKLKTIKENIWLRKSLAAFQFCIAGIVIIAAYIVSQQVSYFFGRDLGYNKEFVVASQVPRDWTPAGVRKMETIRNEFAAMPEVSNVSLAFEIPNGMNASAPIIYRADKDSTDAIPIESLMTDDHYADTYQIPLIAGSFFNSKIGFDSSKIILNEEACRALGWNNPSDAIGRQLRSVGLPIVYTVQGVTKDFHFSTMKQKIQPMIFLHTRLTNTYRFMSFKLKPGNISEAIAAITKKWPTLMPGSSFEYTFMDESLARLYKAELQLKKASYTATLLSLVIVLLGVIGLVSLSIQKRTKEIGIRKVLGASVPSIISLFLKEFVWVILGAIVIACPVAWAIMNGWLSDYAYRVPVTATPFIVTVIGLVIITTLLISLQTIKTGLANPVKSLRTE